MMCKIRLDVWNESAKKEQNLHSEKTERIFAFAAASNCPNDAITIVFRQSLFGKFLLPTNE